jgi:hypothetical protein
MIEAATSALETFGTDERLDLFLEHELENDPNGAAAELAEVTANVSLRRKPEQFIVCHEG